VICRSALEEHTVIDPQQDSPKPDGHARRKLLRGAFSAPAVLAVYSGGAHAAGTFNRCLVRANTSPATAGIGVTTADDTLFRYQLWGLVSNTDATSVLSYWIRGQDLVTMQRASQFPFLLPAQYQQFDITTNALSAIAPTAVIPAQTGYTFKQVTQYVVLRINGTGQVVGAGATGTGAPVSDSCWNSFAINTV
jgi:hypothetical protein